jgi:ribonuclease HI
MNGTPPQSKNITQTAIEESDGPSSAVKFTNDSREDDSDDSEEVEIYINTSDERNNLHMVPVASDLIERARCAFVLFFDGAAKNNPGRAGCGFVLYHRETKLAFCKGCAYLSEATNNEAEYEGILTGLKHAVDLGIKEISIYGDSQLVINQLTGVFQVSAENLRTGHQKGTDLLLQMMNYDLNHISRAANSEADALANQAIRFRQDRTTYYNSHGIAAPVVPLVVREAISAKVTKRVDVSPFRFSRSSNSRGSHSSSSS